TLLLASSMPLSLAAPRARHPRHPHSFPTRRSSDLSTDKVDTEIPSPVAGTIEEILVEEDEDAEVGADLVVIGDGTGVVGAGALRSEEHTSELQSRFDLVCRLLLEKKNTTTNTT